MQKLQTVNAETLLYEPLEKPSFVVDSLIPTGLSLFCGSQKIGKSWLMLKLCLCVSQGIPLWDMTTMEGDVLYLCLEDTFCRIQDRLFRLTNEASRRLHFAVASCKLSDGLIVQLEDYLKDYPDSRLIVIDTLQKVRTASKDNAYASDYGDISLIKDFADRHSLAVIVVHHIRKQNDSDVFNKVSGTTGLTGSADATFVLEKEKRASDTAKLYVTGRDTPYQEYTLRFRDCSYVSKLKDTGKKAAVGVAVTVGATALTGGLALAFAPEIAVVLAGEAVAGLSGAAATNAALAAMGGGALAAGGLGMAGGTAILTGGGALLGLAGASSTSMIAVMAQTSERFTLNECAKLLTFSKLVIVDKYKMLELLNPIISGVESCIFQIESELGSIDTKTKEGKQSKKRIDSSLKYLKNCVRELDALLIPSKNVIGERIATVGSKAGLRLKLEQKDE